MSSNTTLNQYYDNSNEDYRIDDFFVEKIDHSYGIPFIKEHHYSGGCGVASMIYGLKTLSANELIGAIAFQTPISENVRSMVFEKKPYNLEICGEKHVHPQNWCFCDYISGQHGFREHVTELHRMVIIDEAPNNTGSWFISRALKKLKLYKPKYLAVISFADVTEGHDGTVYQASNADYYGMSNPRKFYRDGDGRLRHPRQGGENITQNEANKRGWCSEKRDSKHRYVFWLPDEYQSKQEVREMSEIELMGYPKMGENTHE